MHWWGQQVAVNNHSFTDSKIIRPGKGEVLLDGRDIRSYEPAERSNKIGFILQEPFLFTGTVRENIFTATRLIKISATKHSNKQYRAAGFANLLGILKRARHRNNLRS